MATRPKDFDYQRYLASREWALLKRQVRERCYGNCERCLVGKYEEAHHLTYERIGDESLDDLVGVCRNCHAYLSGFSDSDPRRLYLLFEAKYFYPQISLEEANWLVGQYQLECPAVIP